MTLAEKLAGRIVSTRQNDLTPEAIRYAKIGLLDTIGVTLAGSQEQATRIADRIAGMEKGPSLVIGRGRRTSPLAAAFVNGIAANVLDFDDCTDHLGGHPSAPVLPALLALGENLDARGCDVLLAYVVGFEAETQIAKGVNFHHYEKGWVATATLGVFGAAAASARLLGLSADQTTTALALSASLASGIKSNLGSMAKPLHVGNCARNGLLAALLAQDGFTANADAFEHSQGFLNVFNGPGTYSTERILEKWGSPFDIELPGIAIKQYPCCLSVQSAIDAMLALVRAHGINPEQVARIDSLTYARRLEHTNRPAPRSALEAKLSVQYCLARALMDRKVVLAHFEGDAYRDPDAQRIMTLVHAAAFPHDAPGENDDFAAEIRIATVDGKNYTAGVNRPVGHEPGLPISPELLQQKFEQCATRVLSADQAARVHALVSNIENLASINELTAALAVQSEPRRESARVAR
ncbi:MAG: MmgE/PrpD family protein [Betaproteobacteria bacterium]|nr:MmgE/PrpD family protein [Betaproteobacteria bacterium]